MEDKNLEILYDHYKDSFENQKIYLQRRNKYTLICLVLIATFSFQISNPIQSTIISNELIKKNIGNIEIDFSYINNVLTFALFWIVIMYFQINFLIEKHYTYIIEIEKKLSNKLIPFEIAREGENYLNYYPWLSSLVHRIYTVVFPLMLILVAIIKWSAEKKQLSLPWCNGYFWFDTIFLFGIVISSILYLINRHFNDFRKRK